MTIVYSIFSLNEILYTGGKDGKLRIINMQNQNEEVISIHNSPIVQIMLHNNSVLSSSVKDRNLVETNLIDFSHCFVDLNDLGNFEFGLTVNNVMQIDQNTLYVMNQNKGIELYDIWILYNFI